jgi:hypothetical protein
VTLSLAPVISNISTIWVTSNSATVLWTTDQPASSLVNYGVTTAYGFSSALDSNPVIAHSVTLYGLNANTKYNFAVVASGAANVPSSSSNQTFTTPQVTSVAPVVGSLVVYGVTNSAATIAWSTDVRSLPAIR